MDINSEPSTIEHFGVEWTRFDQRKLSGSELRCLFESYFEPFPWDKLPIQAEGFDMGCGTGRWAAFVAPRVGRLHCIDASPAALAVARRNLHSLPNCRFHCSSFEDLPLSPESMDFGYCLGVLHHVPYPKAALLACVSKLKPGAPFLVYIYYALENRPAWYRGTWRAANAIRQCLCHLPTVPRNAFCDCIAALVYYPLARLSLAADRLGFPVHNIPLSAYRRRSFYVMRNDALDRFGTPVERRMSAAEITDLMRTSGLTNIRISSGAPYWRAIGTRNTFAADNTLPYPVGRGSC
jgi:SAM-dependent methyltransferase